MEKIEKKTRRKFSLFEYDKEQKYLEEMHKKGWKLKGITSYLIETYYFEKCEPEELVYQLDYNQDGIDNKEYIKMFEDCGWEYVYDFQGFTYFCKPVSKMQGREEIFCDDESRLDMMSRILRGRIWPMIALFFMSIFPHVINWKLYYDMKSSRMMVVLGIGVFILFFIYTGAFISSVVNYCRLRKNLAK